MMASFPYATCNGKNVLLTSVAHLLLVRILYHSATLYKRLLRTLTYNCLMQQTCHPTYYCN